MRSLRFGRADPVHSHPFLSRGLSRGSCERLVGGHPLSLRAGAPLVMLYSHAQALRERFSVSRIGVQNGRVRPSSWPPLLSRPYRVRVAEPASARIAAGHQVAICRAPLEQRNGVDIAAWAPSSGLRAIARNPKARAKCPTFHLDTYASFLRKLRASHPPSHRPPQYLWAD